LPLVDTAIRREVWMVTLPDTGISPAVQALAEAIRTTRTEPVA